MLPPGFEPGSPDDISFPKGFFLFEEKRLRKSGMIGRATLRERGCRFKLWFVVEYKARILCVNVFPEAFSLREKASFGQFYFDVDAVWHLYAHYLS